MCGRSAGTPTALPGGVLLDAIFQYRTLVGKCELGVGLEFDDIERVTYIEALFEPTADDRRNRNGRRFRREAVRLTALVRGDRINDRVEVVEFGPGGLLCRKAPYIARNEHVELVIDDGDWSYRFAAKGVWLKEDGDDFKVALVFIGMPVRLHRVAISAHHSDVIDQIAA